MKTKPAIAISLLFEGHSASLLDPDVSVVAVSPWDWGLFVAKLGPGSSDNEKPGGVDEMVAETG